MRKLVISNKYLNKHATINHSAIIGPSYEKYKNIREYHS